MKKIVKYLFILCISSVAFSQTKTVFDVARSGTVAQMELLYKENPSIIETLNENQSSPLILACYRGNTSVALYLIENVKDINHNSGMGTALMAAIVKGKIDLVKKLLDKKANTNLTDVQGVTALMYAIEFQNVEIIKMLLEHNADKSIQNKDGKTAFEYAIFTNNETIINLLK